MDRSKIAVDIHVERPAQWVDDHVDVPAPDHLVIDANGDIVRFHTNSPMDMRLLLDRICDAYYRQIGDDPVPTDETPTFSNIDRLVRNTTRSLSRYVFTTSTTTSGADSILAPPRSHMGWGTDVLIDPDMTDAAEALCDMVQRWVPSDLFDFLVTSVVEEFQEEVGNLCDLWDAYSNHTMVYTLDWIWENIPLVTYARSHPDDMRTIVAAYDAWATRLHGLFTSRISIDPMNQIVDQLQGFMSIDGIEPWDPPPGAPASPCRWNLDERYWQVEDDEDSDIHLVYVGD